MKVFVLYDSQYGNTKKIAEAMASAIPKPHVADIYPVEEVDPEEGVSHYDLLIVGTPTQGGRGTENLQDFLIDIPEGCLTGLKVATFDTRMEYGKQSFFLKQVMNFAGYAAPKIAEMLVRKGATLVAPPEGFFVSSREGPLKDGELERAKEWVCALYKQYEPDLRNELQV